MDDITVVYHQEGGVFWADSKQIPGWSASADFLFDLMEVVRRSLVEQFGDDVEWRSCWEDGTKVIAIHVND